MDIFKKAKKARVEAYKALKKTPEFKDWKKAINILLVVQGGTSK